MNPARLAMLVTGMGLVLIAVAVVYYGTDLRHHIPVGVLIAVLLLMTGLFALALAPYFRSRHRYLDDGYVGRTRYVDDVAPVTQTTIVRDRVRDRPGRLSRSRLAPVDDLDREVTEERIETRRTF